MCVLCAAGALTKALSSPPFVHSLKMKERAVTTAKNPLSMHFANLQKLLIYPTHTFDNAFSLSLLPTFIKGHSIPITSLPV